MKRPKRVKGWLCGEDFVQDEYIILVVVNFIVGEKLLSDAGFIILYTVLLLIDWLIHIMISKT